MYRCTPLRVELRREKCAVCHAKRERLAESDLKVDYVDGSAIHQLYAEENYTYLDMSERNTNDIKTVEKELIKKYLYRVRRIWSTEFKAKNECITPNTKPFPNY